MLFTGWSKNTLNDKWNRCKWLSLSERNVNLWISTYDKTLVGDVLVNSKTSL